MLHTLIKAQNILKVCLVHRALTSVPTGFSIVIDRNTCTY